MGRTFLVIAALLAASDALAQAQQPEAYPPPQQPQAQPPPAPPPAVQPAQPGSPGASSQQVVVNPPSSQQPSTQTAPPSSTTVINPPGGGYYQGDTYVVEREPAPNPFATVAIDAAWGGLAGLIVGFGVTLVNSWDHWDRDLTVGAGVGVLVGAAVGVAHAAYNAREAERRRHVAFGDGLNRTDRDPVITRPTVGYAFRF